MCAADNCEQKPYARGMCRPHYMRWHRLGDPLAGGPPKSMGTPAERFWRKVDQHGPIPDHRPDLGQCWLWTGARDRRDRSEYGRFRAVSNQPMELAHRFAWQLDGRPLHSGQQLDHLCRATYCIRPDHLQPVSNRENTRRGKVSALRNWATHCKHGHPWNDENTYREPKGKRACRTCSRESQRARRAAERAATRL